MSEKSMTLLMIVFIIGGIIAYDRYMVVVKEQFSPIKKIVEYAGLSKYVEIKRKDVEDDYVDFHFTLNEKLNEWNEQMKDLEKGRLHLVKTRNAILDRFGEINQQLAAEAQNYVAMIESERKAFIQRFASVRQLGNILISLQNVSDPAIQQQQYQEVKRALINLFNTVDTDYQRNTDFLTQVFGRVDTIIYGQGEASLEGCLNEGHCLALMVKDIENEFLGILDKKSNKPARDINELIDMSAQLEYESKLLVNNAQATEASLHNEDEITYGEIKTLSDNLAELNEGELLRFMKRYEELQRDQGKFLANLEMNKKRYIETQENAIRRSGEILASIDDQNEFNFMRLKKTYLGFHTEREDLLLYFMNNERDIYDRLNKKKNINDETIYGMAKIVDIDLDYILDQWELAEKEKGRQLKIQYGNTNLFREHPDINNRIENSKRQKISPAQSQYKPTPSQYDPNRNQDSQRAYQDNMRDQRERQRETQRQFERARETARDQGF